MTRFAKRTVKNARRRPLLALLCVLFLVGGGWAASAALASSPPPAPVISSWPVSLTNQTSATFKYSDSQSTGFTKFMCSLDGSAYAACGTTASSGSQSYSGLSASSHTFRVEAVFTSGTSSATSYSWTIDTTPPTVSSFTLAGSSPTDAPSVSWSVLFSEAVTGVSASDFQTVAGGGLGGAAVTGVTGSGQSYTVTASSGTGYGTLGLQIPATATINDLAGNALAGTPVNGPAYTFGTEPYSLFAADAGCSNAGITISGSKDIVGGATHSNGSYKVSGSNNTFGYSDAGCTPAVSGSGNTFGRNGANTPSSGPNSLSFPEPYDASTVCNQPGAHVGTTFTFSGGGSTPSGIYCASSQITLSASNMTANVTFVAPLIQLSGSSLDLSPAYGNLVAYDTNPTLGNNGFQLSGSKDDINGTVYDPQGALALSGSNTKIDGFFEADTITISGSSLDFVGLLSVIGSPSATLWPLPASGPATGIPLSFSNPNSTAQTITSLAITIPTLPSGCSPSDFTIDYGPNPISASNPLTVPAYGTVTLPQPGVSESTILMLDNRDQTACQNKTFTLDYSASGTNPGTGTVVTGKATQFTVSLAPATGGPLLPTAIGDPHPVMETIQVTVSDNDPGDERLNQLVIGIQSGWHNGPAGPTQCNASDFSIDGQPVGTAVTVPSAAVPDGDLPRTLSGGGSYSTSFTVQLVENGLNQDACKNQMPSIQVSAG